MNNEPSTTRTADDDIEGYGEDESQSVELNEIILRLEANQWQSSNRLAAYVGIKNNDSQVHQEISHIRAEHSKRINADFLVGDDVAVADVDTMTVTEEKPRRRPRRHGTCFKKSC